MCVCVPVCLCAHITKWGRKHILCLCLYFSLCITTQHRYWIGHWLYRQLYATQKTPNGLYETKSHRESNTSGRCRDLFLDHFHTFLLGPLTNLFFFSPSYLFIFFIILQATLFAIPWHEQQDESRRATAASPTGWGTSVCKCQPLLNMSATLADKTVAFFTRHKDGGLTPYSQGFWTWHNSRDHEAQVRLLWLTEVTK